MEPGFETAVPVLFLDLHDDLLTPCEDDPEAAVTTGLLFGEKAETMIDLPMISTDQQQAWRLYCGHDRDCVHYSLVLQDQLLATASWDSTVHNTNSLNKITGNNDRVYGIIKVGVTLLHPPGLELMLRKRICLRVYKKMGLGATLMRAFAGRVGHCHCAR